MNTYKEQILTKNGIKIMLHRLTYELTENHSDFVNTVFIGIQLRDTSLARRLLQLLTIEYGITNIPFGILGITFFRDDFRRNVCPLEANSIAIDFIVEDKEVVFIDDVLYTGRNIKTALSAAQSFGRPAEIELLVLIDRRPSRHLLIQPDYRDKQVDAINQERVVAYWKEKEGEDAVYVINK